MTLDKPGMFDNFWYFEPTWLKKGFLYPYFDVRPHFSGRQM